MEKLNINDKSEILWLDSIEHNIIHWENRKVIIFEYFSNFLKTFLYKKIERFWFNFQVKIRKELFSECKKDFLDSEYIDLEKLNLKNNSKYSIVLEQDKEEDLETIKLSEKDLETFISSEKGSNYIYRHYIIINIAEKENINHIVYDFISQIKDSNNIIRLLTWENLKNYLKKDLQSEKQQSFNLEDNFVKTSNSTGILQKIAFLTSQKVKNLTKMIERSFFNQNLNNIDSDIIDILDITTYKHNDYIQTGNRYTWWIYLKWIPNDNFNILKFLFLYLEKWDSITINMYPENKHVLKEIEKTWVDRYLGNKKEEKEEEIYMQILINLSDSNNILLDQKIENFQLFIWEDFYTQRISWSMSRYYATYIWTWENKLNLEKLYNKNRLKNNLIF